jgi:hypothetical protein
MEQYTVRTIANGKEMVSLRTERSICDLFELGVEIVEIRTVDDLVIDFYELPSMGTGDR